MFCIREILVFRYRFCHYIDVWKIWLAVVHGSKSATIGWIIPSPFAARCRASSAASFYCLALSAGRTAGYCVPWGKYRPPEAGNTGDPQAQQIMRDVGNGWRCSEGEKKLKEKEKRWWGMGWREWTEWIPKDRWMIHGKWPTDTKNLH